MRHEFAPSEPQVYDRDKIYTVMVRRGITWISREDVDAIPDDDMQRRIVNAAKESGNMGLSAIDVEDLGTECFGDQREEGKFI